MNLWYNMADALAMPSVTKPADGLNVCVLDAMACGKPILASDCAGNDLVVEHGKNGFLFPEGDAAALADAIVQLASQPQLGRRMGQESRRLIDEALGWPHLARRYRQHFHRLLAAKDV